MKTIGKFSFVLTTCLLAFSNMQAQETINVNTPDASGGEKWSYSVADDGIGVITIHNGANVILIESTTNNRVVVNDSATVMLNGVTVNPQATNLCAFEIEEDANVTLKLKGDNKFESNGTAAGIHVPNTSSLTIEDADSNNGKLTAIGGNNGGSGIGANSEANSGNITINGGTVIAQKSGGTSGNAAIGGDTITVSNAVVIATVNNYNNSAGISSRFTDISNSSMIIANGIANHGNISIKNSIVLASCIHYEKSEPENGVATGEDVDISRINREITLNTDFTVPDGAKFDIPLDWTLNKNGHSLFYEDSNVKTAAYLIETVPIWRVDQTVANTKESVALWLADTINNLQGISDTGINPVTAADITFLSFEPAIAGMSEKEGSFTFTVHLTKRYAEKTTNSSGRITPTNAAQIILVAARDAIQGVSEWTVPQESAGNEEAVRIWLSSRIRSVWTSHTDPHAAMATIEDITFNAFTPATAGTVADLYGEDGSFTAKVKIHYESIYLTPSIDTLNGTIKATFYERQISAVTVGPFNNGSVTPNPTAPLEGSFVTLKIAPAAGYELQSISACKTGDTVTTVPLDGEGDTRTFTMPSFDVTVTASFKKTQATQNKEDVEKAKNLIEAQNASYWTVDQTEANNANSVALWLAGKINSLPDISNWGINAVTAADITFSAFFPAKAGTASANHTGTSGSFYFTVRLSKESVEEWTMEKDGEITPTHVAQVILVAAGNAIQGVSEWTVAQEFAGDEEDVENWLSDRIRNVWKNNTDAALAEIEEITFDTFQAATAGTYDDPDGKDGLFIAKVEIYQELEYLTPSITETVNGTIKATPYVFQSYAVTINSSGNGLVTSTQSPVIEGKTVTLTIMPDNDYELQTISATSATGTTVPLNVTGNDTRTFTMPSSPVTVTAAFKKTQNLIDVETAKGLIEAKNASYWTAIQAVAPNANEVKVWLAEQINAILNTSATGITVEAANVTVVSFKDATAGTPDNPNGFDGLFSFTVQLTKEGVFLTTTTESRKGVITATPCYTVTIGTFADGEVTSNSTALEGSTVTLTIAPDDGYMLENIKVYRNNNPERTLALLGEDNARTFTMPAFPVTVTASFKKTQNLSDVETAKGLIEARDDSYWTLSLTTANNNADAVKVWLAGQINAINGMNATGITVEATNITFGDFNAVTAGTPGNRGSFSFTVQLVKGSVSRTTASKTGAMIYVLLTGVILDPSANLFAGATLPLTAIVVPGNATNQAVSWSSSNSAVADIQSTGGLTAVVSAKAAGNAWIIVKTAEGGFLDSCLVTVTVPVSGVRLPPQNTTLFVNATQDLTATVEPGNATNQAVSWRSSNPTVADLSTIGGSTAVVTIKSTGEAWIIVTTTDGSYTDSCFVNVPVGGNFGVLRWILADNVLTVSGSGAMEDFEIYSSAPWYAHRNAIKSVVIENGVTHIGAKAFYAEYGNLTSVTIGESVKSIGNYAFGYCTALTSVTDLRLSPQTIDASVFYELSLPDITLYVPAGGSRGSYLKAAVWQEFKKVQRTEITGAEHSDATLDYFVVSNSDQKFVLDPPFFSERTAYTLNVANSVSSVTIAATPIDLEAAIISGDDTWQLAPGNNNILKVVVEAESGIRKTYTVTVTREFGTGIPSVAEPGAEPAEARVYSDGRNLYIDSPVAERISVYSVTGVLFYGFDKQAGVASTASTGSAAGLTSSASGLRGILIVKGSSGWVRKLVIGH